MQEAAGPVHFRDERGQWLTIDPHLQPGDMVGVYHAPSQEVPTSLDAANGTASIQLRDGSLWTFGDETIRFPNGEALSLHTADARVGRDGVRYPQAHVGVEVRRQFRESRIKTNWILDGVLPPIAVGPEVAFVQSIQLPEHLEIAPDGSGGFHILRDGQVLGGVERPLVYDFAGNFAEVEMTFDHQQLEVLVPIAWLHDPDRVFPVTVDPLLYGTNTYTLGDIGFNYDATCFDLATTATVS